MNLDYSELVGADADLIDVAERSEVLVRWRNGLRDLYMYSDDAKYRWRFDRRWCDGPSLTWVGLNPGTGDSDGTARPTLRRMVEISKQHGYGALTVVNLYAWRASRPVALGLADDPIGLDNDVVVRAATSPEATDRTVVCWGAGARWTERAHYVATRLIATPMLCLGTAANGAPRHPLYVKGSTGLVEWTSRQAKQSGPG